MEDFFNSPFFKKIEQTGELPAFNVGLEDETLVKLGVSLILVFLICLLLFKLIK